MQANLSPTMLIGDSVVQLDIGELGIAVRSKEGRGVSSVGTIEELGRVLNDVGLTAAANKALLDRVVQVVDRCEFVVRANGVRVDLPTDVRLELQNASYFLADLVRYCTRIATDTDEFDKAAGYFHPGRTDVIQQRLTRMLPSLTGV